MTRVPTWTVVIAAIFGVLGVVISIAIVVNPAAVPMTAGLESIEEVQPLVAPTARATMLKY